MDEHQSGFINERTSVSDIGIQLDLTSDEELDNGTIELRMSDSGSEGDLPKNFKINEIQGARLETSLPGQHLKARAFTSAVRLWSHDTGIFQLSRA